MQSIDIILPFYNGSKYIKSQLESIFSNSIHPQTSLKILIINDHSSDLESENLREVCQVFKGIEIYRNEKNLGIVKTIEKGLSLSRSDYVMLCDQDDHWLPHKIEMSLKKILNLDSGSPALVFTDLKIVDQDLKPLHPSMFKLFKYEPSKLKNSILIQNMVTGCTIILNRKLIDIAVPFPDDLLIHDHWLAICAAYGGNIDYVDEPTILYRQHCSNLIGARKASTLQKLKKIRNILLLKHNSHIQKASQTAQLAIRLRGSGITKNISFLEKVSKSLESNSFSDVLFLRNSKVINFVFTRSFTVTAFFVFVTSYKILRRQVSK